MNIIYQLSG